jgi:branched-chain amino acid aminotransferase
MEPKVYIDGELYPKSEAKISVYDHGLLYGDGVFEGIRIYSGRIFRFKEHIERLYQSARSIALDIPLKRESLEKALRDTVIANGMRDGYIRLVVTRGVGDLGLDPVKCKKGSVIIIVDKIQLYPEKVYQEGIKVVIAATRRLSPDMISPRTKSLNYLNNILAKMEAAQAGCSESLMLNAQGMVTECTADNIFIVRDGELLTPAPDQGILLGITRQATIELAREQGISVREVPLARYDIYLADECFLTGTGAELVPVVSLDERKIGNGKPGPITGKLLKVFRELRESEGDDLFS